MAHFFDVSTRKSSVKQAARRLNICCGRSIGRFSISLFWVSRVLRCMEFLSSPVASLLPVFFAAEEGSTFSDSDVAECLVDAHIPRKSAISTSVAAGSGHRTKEFKNHPMISATKVRCQLCIWKGRRGGNHFLP